ncbi:MULTISPECIES: hypothetical protein [unclassified Lonepinella]|uniref:hypothetical protein n=1 Tax=unclassified Lonepinella TaxID=2642006 RepID=UPI0036DD0D14
MNNMFKDAGNQSIFWGGFSAFWAMYTVQEWLALLGLAIGVISGLVNLCAKHQESVAREHDERRKQEMHELKMQQLRRGLRDE